MAKISVILCSYNAGKYIVSTLKSILNQSFSDFEVLILDNASTDETCNYIESFQDSRIKLFRGEKNIGPYAGLNILLTKAGGKYIAIQDHDDIWHPDKLQKQFDFLENNPQYIGCGTKTIMYYEGDKKYFEYFLWTTNYYTIHPSLMFRNTWDFEYDITHTEYMCDAWSLKNKLCHGEKKIYNLDISLTLHLIKKGSSNYSYRWHRLTWKNIQRVYSLHSFSYASLTLIWESLRKILYPLLQKMWYGKLIDPMERFPFRVLGNTIQKLWKNDWFLKYFS